MERAYIKVYHCESDEILVHEMSFEGDDACKKGYWHWKSMTDIYADEMQYARVGRDFNDYLLGEIILRPVHVTESM